MGLEKEVTKSARSKAIGGDVEWVWRRELTKSEKGGNQTNLLPECRDRAAGEPSNLHAHLACGSGQMQSTVSSRRLKLPGTFCIRLHP